MSSRNIWGDSSGQLDTFSSRRHSSSKNCSSTTGSCSCRKCSRSGSSSFPREIPPYPPDIYDVTPYIVDSNGNSPYTNLADAFDAAYKDCNKGVPTVYIRPGVYDLPDNLRSTKRLNIVGINMTSVNPPLIRGCGVSGGNKSWMGVMFSDPKGEYSVNNGKSCDQARDMFCKCKFTNNFRIWTMNDRMEFLNSEFAYGNLDRDRIIEVCNGKGSMMFCKTKFNFCRTGSSCTKSFIYLGGMSTESESITLFKSCIFGGEVGGNSTFVMIHTAGISPVRIEQPTVTFSLTTPKVYTIGSPIKQRNINLKVQGGTFESFDYGNDNMTVLANAWPARLTKYPITMHSNTLTNSRAMWYGDTECNNYLCDCKQKKICCSSDGTNESAISNGKKCYKCCHRKKNENDSNCATPSPDTSRHFIIWSNNHIIPNSKEPFFIRHLDNDSLHLNIVANQVFAPASNSSSVIFSDQDEDILTYTGEFVIVAALNIFNNESRSRPPWLTYGVGTAVNLNSSTVNVDVDSSIPQYGPELMLPGGIFLFNNTPSIVNLGPPP